MYVCSARQLLWTASMHHRGNLEGSIVLEHAQLEFCSSASGIQCDCVMRV